MKTEYANQTDYKYILENDKHVSKELIETKINEKEILVVYS